MGQEKKKKEGTWVAKCLLRQKSKIKKIPELVKKKKRLNTVER